MMVATPPDFGSIYEDLDRAFDEAIEPLRTGAKPFGILYSGGIDSSLIAWELRRRPETALYTLGCDGSSDLRAGEFGAGRLGLPWGPLTFTESSLAAAERRFSTELEGSSPVARSVLVALALAISECPTGSLLCGQGADELFLGYSHYRGLSAADAAQRTVSDLGRLLQHDWPRTVRIARQVGKEIAAPYLVPGFREAVTRIPIELRMPADTPKGLFRDWARHRGLPSELVDRPKKALQYGSGVDRLIRRRRRSER